MQTEYDLAERPMQSTLRDGDGNVLYRATLTYDAQNRLQTFHERTGDEYHKTAFTYDKDSRVTQMDYDDTDRSKVEYTYDTLGRVSSRKVTGGETAYETAYTFVKGADTYGGNATTPLVASIRQGEGGSAMNFDYEYDSRGNITSETRNGKVTTYTYDALGQLIRVNDPNDPTAGESGTTWLYTYDRGGNILSKSYYSYTTGTPGVAHDTILYSYTDNNWKDKLTAYDGQTITYDAIGNPLNDGRRRYEWQAGRQLKKVYVKADLKEGTKPGVDEQSGTVLKIAWSNGNLLDGEVTSTQASAIVTRNGVDVTEEYAASAFAWKRDSGNAEADAAWNAAHAGKKAISLTTADLNGDVKITCTLTGNGPSYGSIAVDEDMDATHTRGTLDANDTFQIVNGELKVTTSRGNVYALEDGNVKGAGAKLNGSITAESKLFASQPEDMVEFSYDHNGLRTQKKVTKADGTVETTDYVLHGKLVTHLTRGSDEMHFFYDAQSKPAMVEFNGAVYSYIHNLQGDVVGIVDSAGSLVVEYKYDAWGKPTLVRTLTTAYEALAELNPFRYRGYVYDEETRLYYLRSRYYNPVQKRFINLDNIIKGISLFINMFSYCANNPVSYVDPDGHSFLDWVSNTANSIKNWASDTWDSVRNKVSDAWNDVKKWATNTWNDVKNWATNAWNDAKNWATNAWNDVKNWATNAWNDVKNWATNAWNDVKNWATNAWNDVKNWATNAWNDASAWLSAKWDWTKNALKDWADNYVIATLDGSFELAGYVSLASAILMGSTPLNIACGAASTLWGLRDDLEAFLNEHFFS